MVVFDVPDHPMQDLQSHWVLPFRHRAFVGVADTSHALVVQVVGPDTFLPISPHHQLSVCRYSCIAIDRTLVADFTQRG